tara:strand:- start:7164 stop:7277 length:114 start_codon:yes stop_codon:yes gene_type:complete
MGLYFYHEIEHFAHAISVAVAPAPDTRQQPENQAYSN